MVRRHLLVGLAAVVVALAAPTAAQAALRFERCGGYGYQCARLSVPLDHSGAVPGRLSLRIQRLRSRIQPARGAVFVLAGGPGQSATAAFAGDGAGLLYAAHRSRDAIVFDQRGTGLSGALRCRSLEEANLLDATTAAARCAAALGPKRGFYTSADTVEDMEAIRRELGVERIAHLRNLLRHQGRAGLRAPLSGARGAARARLGGGGRTARMRSTATRFAADAAGPAGALPQRLPLVHARSGRRSRSGSWQRLRGGPAARPARGRAGPDPALEPDEDGRVRRAAGR